MGERKFSFMHRVFEYIINYSMHAPFCVPLQRAVFTFLLANLYTVLHNVKHGPGSRTPLRSVSDKCYVSQLVNKTLQTFFGEGLYLA